MNPLKEIKWFIQRGRRGFADCDVWDFDNYLSKVIAKGLRHLAKDNHGCSTKFYDESNKGNECQKWEDILIEIAEGFELYLDDKSELNTIEDIKIRKSRELFIEHFSRFWD